MRRHNLMTRRRKIMRGAVRRQIEGWERKGRVLGLRAGGLRRLEGWEEGAFSPPQRRPDVLGLPGDRGDSSGDVSTER